ncbi:hornerin-like [Plakobranchus ocellatus]|uniref:Hornerin-like n=1 Tax=Plakobranchus ocellatus TaxID=259542 RepID=A0AAV3YVT2_9GAST|nr:hornerin-like [Plakobranchus ocellatus]
MNDCELYTRKILSNEEKVYSYCINDREKLFFGTNSKELLMKLKAVQGTNHDQPDITDHETVMSSTVRREVAPTTVLGVQPSNGRKRKYVSSTADTTSHLADTVDDEENIGPSSTKYFMDEQQQPQKRPKALQNLDTVKDALTKYPYCATFSDLVSAIRGTPVYDTICAIYLDNRADKIWNLAREELVNHDEDIDLFKYLHELPDELKNTLTPMQTLALFNAWCEEQGVNAKALAWFITSRLQNRAYKKIGLYLQGASKSGKTYWTSTLFSPLGALVGKMTTGGRFCLQDCERKKIIVGEEIGIGLDNIDRIKELMSGEVTTCERKGRSVVRCKASLVLLNSNNMPAFNV